ncbi:MAG: hypothetical protein AAGA48_11200 [Myxococcota bacterium]
MMLGLLAVWFGGFVVLANPEGSDAPATTLLHDVEVRVDGLLRLTERVVWTVRIDDPEACAAGVAAPAGLSGATDRGAVILDDLLVIPDALPAGTVLTLRGQRSASPRLPHSGLLVGVPGVPAAQTRLSVTTPSNTELSVWADERAVGSFVNPDVHEMVFEWGPHSGEQPSLASYSTFASWGEAGRVYRSLVEAKVGPGRELGKAVAQDLAGLPVVQVVERMNQRLPFDPERPEGFEVARATRVLRGVEGGSASERALLLTTMLRTAGYEASIVLVRPASQPGRFPATVVAPFAYSVPAVRVTRPDRPPLYVDPALPPGERGGLPATLRGAEVWAFGEVPKPLPVTSLSDGTVAVTSSVAVSESGMADFEAVLSATGAADDEIRMLLRPLDAKGREEAWRRLVAVGWPQAESVSVTFEGLDRPSDALIVRTRGRTKALQTTSYGVSGTLPPVLAPALGAWLPPRLRVEESLTLTLPGDWQVLGASITEAAFSERAEIARTIDQTQGRDGVDRLRVEVLRRSWEASPSEEAEAVRFLKTQAQEGVRLVIASGGPAKAARRLEGFSGAEQAALEGLGWVAAGRVGRARSRFKAAERGPGLESLVRAVSLWAPPSDERPWRVLDKLSRKDDRSAVAVLEGLARIGEQTYARPLMERLARSEDPQVRTRVELVRIRFFGEPGEPQPPAEVAGDRLADRERIWLSLHALRQGRVEAGRTWVEALVDPSTVGARAARLALSAFDAAPRQTVVRLAKALLAVAPSDPEGLAAVALALAEVNELRSAAAVLRTAARREPRVVARWDAVVAAGLAAGDLPLALDAAMRAHRLRPEDEALAERVVGLAEALGEPGRVTSTYEGLGRSVPPVPPSLDARMATRPEATAAILNAAALRDRPDRLAARARLRLSVGDRLGAARDGMVLAHRHREPNGLVIATAATAGQQFATPLTRALTEAAPTNERARTVLAERAWITGDPTPKRIDATSSDRLSQMMALIERPLSSAKELEGWPDPAPVARGPVPTTPAVPNRFLGAHPGVQAWSDHREPVALLQVPGTLSVLPPPLGLLYTLDARPERDDAGVWVVRLRGGELPLYAARRFVQGHTRYGLGFTPSGAERALRRGWSTSPRDATASPISPDGDNR